MAVSSTVSSAQNRIRFVNIQSHKEHDSQVILTGLSAPTKTIEPRFFYDSYGSDLFEQITETEEYYPTRTEREILWQNRHAIAEAAGRERVLIEPGSGSSEKVRLLLNALQPSAYVPIDIAEDFLQGSAQQLALEFPWLPIHALCADFSQLAELPAGIPHGSKLIFYPGSTLGNMHPDQAVRFLSTLRGWLNQGGQSGGGLLIGIDTHKSSALLNAAYNDQAGVTAAFNLNVLTNVNRIADANFDLDKFSHRAFYNSTLQRIEMYLISNCEHQVEVAGETIAFAKGESIHTECSYKYTLLEFQQLAEQAGFRRRQSWLDEQELFSLHYLQADLQA